METIKKFIFGTIAVFCMLVFAACFSHWEGDEGTLVFNFRSASAGSRGVFVEGDEYLDFRHVVYLRNANGRLIEAGEFTGDKGTISAPIGNYTVIIKGYHETEGLHSYGISERTVKISGGRRTDVELDMHSAIEVRDQFELKNAFDEANYNPTRLLYIFIKNSFDVDGDDYEISVSGKVTLIAETDVVIDNYLMYADLFELVDSGILSLGIKDMQGKITINGNNVSERVIVALKGQSNSELFMYEGVTIQSHSNSAVSVGNYTKFNMHGGIIRENGRGIEVNGEFNMHGGYITENICGSDGAGVYVSGAGAIFNMDGGFITKNSFSYHGANGGGVCIINGATFNMKGGTISENTTDSSGGGVVVSGGSGGSATFNMSGGYITKNISKGSGGGVTVGGAFATFKMTGGYISENIVTHDGEGRGGGVLLEYPATFIMDGGTISKNIVNGDGGGVHASAESITFDMSRGTITENEANRGGGVFFDADANANLTMSGGIITKNKAVTSGGGVYLTMNAYEFTMSGGIISENIAGENGGGINVDGNFNFQSGTISSNQAEYGGGIYIAGNMTMSGSGNISKNEAINGGGVNVSGGSFTMVGGVISGNTARDNGGGVWVGGDGSGGNGNFEMSGGIVYGMEDFLDPELRNTLLIIQNPGAALYVGADGSADIFGYDFIDNSSSGTLRESSFN